MSESHPEATDAPRARATRKTASSDDGSDPTTRYARRVVAEQILAGPHVRAACARHLRDLENAPARGLTFDREVARRALEFFPEVLRLNGGQFEGQPFVLLGYEEFIIGSIFGWLRADGTRRFRTAYIEMGKGNGKSPLAAGIGLYCLTSDNEYRAEIYAAATKKDQAMILFRDAVAMVDLSPALAKRVLKTPAGPACHNLAYLRTASFFRAIASEDKQSGPRPHCFLIDEVHEHPDATMVNMASAGRKWRRQPLVIEITNSGFDRDSVCWEHHQYSISVVTAAQTDEANFNDEWFAYVCALDDGDEPFADEACWPKANPGLFHIIQPAYIRAQLREAHGMPSKQSSVARLNFCQWVGAENPWIDGDFWLRCEREFDPIATLAECDDLVGAIDLSGTRDLTALSIVGEHPDGRVKAYTEFWTPLDTLQARARTDRVPYELWVRQGFLHATPGRAVDYAWVARRLAELTVLLPALTRACFDPYRISFLEPELDTASVEIELIAHPQGGYRTLPKTDRYGRAVPSLWMPRSIEVLGNIIGEGRLDVHRNPCMTYCSASAVLVATDDKGNQIFSKRKSRGRIDGIVTLAMAIGLLETSTDNPLADLLKSAPL
jgi:phage terminase large subunit-like protein